MKSNKPLPIVPFINNPINTVDVEGNAIKAISPSFSVLGGQPHSKGGTLVQFGNSTVEAQKGEPLSMDENGSVIAWGKMKNPLTGKLFESDAKTLAEAELKTIKKQSRGTDMVNKYDYAKPIQAYAFGTGKVLMDASAIEQKANDSIRDKFAKTQQTILDYSEALGIKSEKLAEKIAKNGITMGGTMKVRIRQIPQIDYNQAQYGVSMNPYEDPNQYPQLMQNDVAKGNTYTQQQDMYGNQQPQPIPQNQQPTEQVQSEGGGMAGAIGKVGAFAVNTINGIGALRRGIAVAAPQILNSLIPDIHNDREKTIQKTYNQYAYGTGSKAMYRFGGMIPKAAYGYTTPRPEDGGGYAYAEDKRKQKYQGSDAYMLNANQQKAYDNGDLYLPFVDAYEGEIRTTQELNPEGTYGDPKLKVFNDNWRDVYGRDLTVDGANVLGFQRWHGAETKKFNERYGKSIDNYFEKGNKTFKGEDNQFGNHTQRAYRPNVPVTLSPEQLAKAQELGIIKKDGQGKDYIAPKDIGQLGVEGTYADGFQMYRPTTPNRTMIQGEKIYDAPKPHLEYEPMAKQEPINIKETIAKVNEEMATKKAKEEPVKLGTLADKNKLGITSMLSEIAGLLDKPNYVPKQNPELYLNSPFQVSFQDRVNSNMSIFNQQAQMMKGDPAALATLAAQARQGNDGVLADEFRTNQGISNQVATQNLGMLNQNSMQRANANDQQFVRQEQARENAKRSMTEALKSISAKVLTNKAENTAIRLVENMSKFRVNDEFKIENYNPDPTFRRGNVSWAEMTLEQKKEALPYAMAYTEEQKKKNEDKVNKVTAKYGRRFN